LCENPLAAHQLNRVITEYDGGTRHLADLIGPLGARNIDIRLIDGEAVHSVGELQ